jgi:hypothetical protein
VSFTTIFHGSFLIHVEISACRISPELEACFTFSQAHSLLLATGFKDAPGEGRVIELGKGRDSSIDGFMS